MPEATAEIDMFRVGNKPAQSFRRHDRPPVFIGGECDNKHLRRFVSWVSSL